MVGGLTIDTGHPGTQNGFVILATEVMHGNAPHEKPLPTFIATEPTVAEPPAATWIVVATGVETVKNVWAAAAAVT
jgi:hypothetical protein